MGRAFVIVFLLWGIGLRAQDAGYRNYYAKAIEAYKAKKFPEFYELIKEAHALHPYHQGVLYQLGIAAALNGHKAEAIDNLKKAILIDNSFRVEGLPDFNLIKDSPEFKKLLALQRENAQAVIHSDTAFVLKDRTLHTEGIEYNPQTKTFYLGSIHQRKVVKVKDGIVSDFCASATDGMTSIFGLKIDTKRNLLWACSSPMHEMAGYDSTARSAVFKFDLTAGKLLEKFQRPTYENDGVFGDLIMDKKGRVYVSDGQTNIIYRINEKTHQLEPWYTSDQFSNLQGMSFSDDEKFMFAADYIKGIFRIAIKEDEKDLSTTATERDVSLKGIDGLYFYNRSLIAIQNGVSPLRVTRYYLNDKMERIERFEIIDRKHPAFNEPTLGVISGTVFYYIANSQWEGYDLKHQIKPTSQLQDIVILKSALR